MSLSPEEITTSIQKIVRESYLFSGEAAGQEMDRYKFGLEIYHLIKHIVPNYTLGQVETLASEFWQEYSKPVESVPEQVVSSLAVQAHPSLLTEADQVEAVPEQVEQTKTVSEQPVPEEPVPEQLVIDRRRGLLNLEEFDPTALINIDIDQVLHSENPVRYREFFTIFKKYLVCSPHSISNSCVARAIVFLWHRYKKEQGNASSDCFEPAPEEPTPIPFMDNVNTTPSPNADQQSEDPVKEDEKVFETPVKLTEDEKAMGLEEDYIRQLRIECPEEYLGLRKKYQSMYYENPIQIVYSIEGKPEKAALLINRNLVSRIAFGNVLTLRERVYLAGILATVVDYNGQKIVNGFSFVSIVHEIISNGSEEDARICLEKILPRVAVKSTSSYDFDVYPSLFYGMNKTPLSLMNTFRQRAVDSLLCSGCGPSLKALVERIVYAPCRTGQILKHQDQDQYSPDNNQYRLKLMREYREIVALC